MSNAEPWMGSNIDGFSRVGSRLLVGAIPMEPARAAARSDRISACWGSHYQLPPSMYDAFGATRGLWRTMTYQVRSYNRIQAPWLQHHPSCHRIHQHLLPLHVWVVRGYFGRHLVPEHHPITLCIALRHDRQQLPLSTLRRLKRKSHDSLHSVSSKDRYLRCCLPGPAGVAAASLTCILALGVLADDHPVQFPRRAGSKGGLGAAEDLCWSYVGILLQGLADSQSQAPE